MSEYDVFLNGTGFMLAKDGEGRPVPGAAREQIVDPFTTHFSRDEPYTRVPFKFGEGGGLTEYDGSHRYEWGQFVDSRSGRLMNTPERFNEWEADEDMAVTSARYLYDIIVNSGGGTVGIAQRYQTPADATGIRAVGILVKRSSTVDYSTASDFTVAIYSDTTGPKPNASLGSVDISVITDHDMRWPFVDRWRTGEYFWIEAVFASTITVGASTYYWLAVTNNQTPPIYMAGDQMLPNDIYRSVFNGTTWGDGATNYPFMAKIGYKDSTRQLDSFPRCMAPYRGTDGTERMYSGTAYRILYADPGKTDANWSESMTVGAPVTQLIEFNELLFAACGPDTDFWYSDGDGCASTAWTQVSSQKAHCFAIYDNMLWKADGCTVKGSEDGTTWTASGVDVGDPGTIVSAMTAHGGKLFAAKPEGVYEISYPDTYPDTGDPTCNLMLDFTTERNPRTWLLDWHSGLYFGGFGGVYELKFDVLRNLWADKVDEGAIDTGRDLQTGYTRPRSWAALYDTGPVAWAGLWGTTRGVMFARSSPHLDTAELIWFDGDNWYPIRQAGDWGEDGATITYGEYITAVCLQDIGGGRGLLWFNEGFKMCRVLWPTWTEDTWDAGSVEYEMNGQITTPWFSLEEKTKEFLLCKVGVVTENLASDVLVGIAYRIDDDTSWTALGALGSGDSPYEELDFSAQVSCRRVQFRITLQLDTDGEIPAIVEQMDLFYQTLPEPTRTHQLMIDASSSQELREGGVDERSAAEVMADLRALVGNTGFTYIDPLGASHTVRVTALTGQLQDLVTEPGTVGAGQVEQAIVNLLEL